MQWRGTAPDLDLNSFIVGMQSNEIEDAFSFRFGQVGVTRDLDNEPVGAVCLILYSFISTILRKSSARM